MDEDRDRQEKRADIGSGPNYAGEVPTGQPSMFHEVKITKAANGFIVKVGCQTYVGSSWTEVALALDLYWQNPSEAARKYSR